MFVLGSNLNEVSAQMWFFCSLILSATILLYDGIALVARLSLKWGWSIISTPFKWFWSIMEEVASMIIAVVCSPWTLLKYLGAKYSDFVHQRKAELVDLPEKPEPIRKGILEKLEQIEKLLANKKNLESIQSGSDFYESEKFPVGFVLIRKTNGDQIGCGFITKINGKHVLLSAAHVFDGHKGIIVSTQDKHLSLDQPEMFLTTDNSDIAGIRLPTDACSKLGVKCAKIDRTPAEGTGFQVYGYFRGKFAQTIGVIKKDLTRFFFTHTASTVNGWSGSPIYGPNNKVVGIHSRSLANGNNCGVSLDFIVTNMETEYKDNYLKRLADSEELENEDDWMMEMDGMTYIGKAGKKAWRMMRDDREFRGGNLGGFQWADEFDDESGEGDFGRTESLKEAVQVFQERPSGGAATTTIGTVTESQTTSGESEGSKSTASVAKPNSTAPKKKRSKKSKSLKDGSGQTGETKPPSKVSDSIAGSSKKEAGDHEGKKMSGSLDSSWMTIYTQELLDQTSRGVSAEMAAIAARLHANAITGKTHTLTL